MCCFKVNSQAILEYGSLLSEHALYWQQTSLDVLNVKCFVNDSLNAFTLISGLDCIVNVTVFLLVSVGCFFSNKQKGSFAERWEAEGVRKRNGKTGLLELWHLWLFCFVGFFYIICQSLSFKLSCKTHFPPFRLFSAGWSLPQLPLWLPSNTHLISALSHSCEDNASYDPSPFFINGEFYSSCDIVAKLEISTWIASGMRNLFRFKAGCVSAMRLAFWCSSLLLIAESTKVQHLYLCFACALEVFLLDGRVYR